MKEKFKSRKFWMAVIGALLMIANEGLDLELDSNTIMAFAGIVISYILGQGYVDGQQAKQIDK